ncbi:unnamed protein product [Camellia sinensis]
MVKIKKLVQKRKIDILLLQESKRSSVDSSFVKSMWPWESLQFMAVDSEGSARGLLCVWNPEVFNLVECCSARSFILLSGTYNQSFGCVVVNIYAPNDSRLRSQLWEVLFRLRLSFQQPWCIGGDFNEVRSMGERKGCLRRDRGMSEFNEFLEKMELCDLPMLGRRFTWCNSVEGERWSRIDRFVVDLEWLEVFRLKQWGLPRIVSDHCPLLLMEDVRNWGPRPFRFINAWFLHPDFKTVVKKSWEEANALGWAGYRLKGKLAKLKSDLTKWNVDVFDNMKHQLKIAEEELHEIDLLAEDGPLLGAAIDRRRELRSLVWNYSRRLEWLWRQKSRLKWAQEGDKNTRFFHVVASRRQSKNVLDSVVVDGVRVDDPEQVKQAVFRHFKDLYFEV